MKLLLATKNRGKVKDLQAMLNSLDVEVCSLADFPELPDVEEDAGTFLGNARKKALFYHQATGISTLADDSGLEVDSLGGEPGVHSARYAGPNADDASNLRKLLGALASRSHPTERTARFRCVLVLLPGDGSEIVTTGDCEGCIAHEARGDNGFGYDPVFVHPDFGGRTLGEVTREEKNRVSHRGMALRAMIRHLANLSASKGGTGDGTH